MQVGDSNAVFTRAKEVNQTQNGYKSKNRRCNLKATELLPQCRGASRRDNPVHLANHDNPNGVSILKGATELDESNLMVSRQTGQVSVPEEAMALETFITALSCLESFLKF
jgi:hypothetical protein